MSKIKCPICEFSSENLTAHIIKTHNMSVKDFKFQYDLKYIQSDRLRNIHKKNIDANNPTLGKSRSAEEILLMSKNRLGKGIGVAGKYERTPEIKSKISKGVTDAHFRGDFDNVKMGISTFIYSKKANRTIFARSTWESQLIEIFDQHPLITSVSYESLIMPYVFEGSKHNYIPDFLLFMKMSFQVFGKLKEMILF